MTYLATSNRNVWGRVIQQTSVHHKTRLYKVAGCYSSGKSKILGSFFEKVIKAIGHGVFSDYLKLRDSFL